MISSSTGYSNTNNLQNLYNNAAQDILSGNSAAATQDTKRAASVYAKQNPGATVQDFAKAFSQAESGKVSSSAINNVVNQILPTGDEASTTSISAIASEGAGGSHRAHGGGGGGGGAGDTSTSTNTVFDPSTGQYVQE